MRQHIFNIRIATRVCEISSAILNDAIRAILNTKTVFRRYEYSHVKDKTVARPSCLVHPGVRDKRRVSEIDLSQPRHETAFGDVTMGQWRHNQPTQLSDLIIH